LESGISYKDFWDMTLIEVDCCIKKHNKDIEISRRNQFLAAKLISFSFNDPQNIPNYEDVFIKKEIDEDSEIKEIEIKNEISECNLKYFFEQKKHFVINKEV
jgi:hypothetical protein